MARKTIIVVWLVALALALFRFAEAQQSTNVPLIGVLAAPSASFFSTRIGAFRQGLRELGYLEGKNISIEYRYAEGKLDRLPDLAAELETAAKALGLMLQSLPVRGLDDIEPAFEAAKRLGAQALLTNPNPVINTQGDRIMEFAAKNRLPAMYPSSEFVEAGGLMSYAPSYPDVFRRATYVDKILKGRKPADLPVEQPTKFDFVINLKTAKQIGVTIPQSVLFRADKVIK